MSVIRALTSSLCFLAAVQLLCSIAHAAPSGVSLSADFIQKKGKVTCGYINGKWEAGRSGSRLFFSHLATINDLKKSLKKAPSKKRAAINRNIARLKRTRTDQNKKVCSRIKTRPALFGSLAKIPATSRLVQANTAQAGSLAVSGQPPALIDIPQMEVKSLYWQSGLIDGVNASTASLDQCRDFWFGDQDGDSGGMNACNMTGQLGYTFNPIMAAGVTLCRLQAMPNPQLLASGAIQVTKGSLAEAARIFDPGSANKLVRVQISGPEPALIYARIYSAADNIQNGYQYRADLWQCAQVTDPAVLRHSIIVDNNNRLTYGFYSHQGNFTAGGYQFVVEAALAQAADGTSGFDLSQERSARVENITADGSFGYRQDIRITPENLLKIKSRWLFDYGWRTDYIVSRFMGTNIRDLRLYEGAIKALDHNNGELDFASLNGVEFRDSTYAAAPESAIIGQANEANFSSDTFFTNPPSVQIDTVDFPCNLEPDIGVVVNGASEAVASPFANCSQYTMWSNNFCATDPAVSQARQSWESYCAPLIATSN